MKTARCPAGLHGYGYSMQAAAIASALVERHNAHIYRKKVREWLDRTEHPADAITLNMEESRVFAEFLTDLARIGSGLTPAGEMGRACYDDITPPDKVATPKDRARSIPIR